jgi:hypothetical protein
MHDLAQWVAQNQYLLWTMRKSCMKHSGEATLVSASNNQMTSNVRVEALKAHWSPCTTAHFLACEVSMIHLFVCCCLLILRPDSAALSAMETLTGAEAGIWNINTTMFCEVESANSQLVVTMRKARPARSL